LLQIAVPGKDAEIHLSGIYFLNVKPATKAPHFQWNLPRTGSLEGQIDVTGGTLPEDLMMQISTQSTMTDDSAKQGKDGPGSVLPESKLIALCLCSSAAGSANDASELIFRDGVAENVQDILSVSSRWRELN
jgi:hypothetical protein